MSYEAAAFTSPVDQAWSMGVTTVGLVLLEGVKTVKCERADAITRERVFYLAAGGARWVLGWVGWERWAWACCV